MIRINLYKKDTIDMNLLIGSYEKERFNMPFYNTNITLWKGVDNTVEFSIRNHDRKAEKIPEGSKLVFTAINNKLQQIIKKDLETVNANLGRYSITISKDELNDYDAALFIGHVSVVDEAGNEDLLYSGTDWLPNFEVEIKPNKLELIPESETATSESFIREVYQDPESGKQMEKFTSPAFEADITEYHTFFLKVSNFNGKIKIQGSCCEPSCQCQANWFDIDEKDFTEEPFTGNISDTYKLNCLWVRVQYIRELDTESVIDEVYYRN